MSLLRTRCDAPHPTPQCGSGEREPTVPPKNAPLGPGPLVLAAWVFGLNRPFEALIENPLSPILDSSIGYLQGLGVQSSVQIGAVGSLCFTARAFEPFPHNSF